MIGFLINEIKKLGAAQSEDKTFILVTFGSAGARIGHKLSTVTRARGIPLDWGLVITGNSVEEKFLVESGVSQDRIIRLLDEGVSREIELGCEKIEERKTEIIEKIKRFLNRSKAIIIVIGGYAGGVSGGCCREEILEGIAQYSNADAIFYFAIASYEEDADEMVLKNEAHEFENLAYRASHDSRFARISLIVAQNRFPDHDYCNKVLVDEAILPLLKCLSVPDFSGEQRLKKRYLTGVVATIATAEEEGVKSDKQSLRRLVDNSARNNAINAPDPGGMFDHIVALIQLPIVRISDSVRRILKEEIAARFDISLKSVDVFGAPEDRTSVTRLVLLCCGIKDMPKYRESGLFKMLEKSRNIEIEELDEWKRRTGVNFYNANHTDGEDKKSEEEED